MPVLALFFVVCAVTSACRDSAKPTEIAPNSTKSSAASTRAVPETLASQVTASEQWYGVYMGGKKVGHATMHSRPTRSAEPGAWATQTRFSMQVSGMGNIAKVALTELRFYGAKAPHRLVGSEFRQMTSGMKDRRVATLRGDAFHIERFVNGAPKAPMVVQGVTESLADLAATMPLSTADAKVGEVETVGIFDWQKMAQIEMEVTTAAVDTSLAAGVETRVVTYKSLLKGSGMKMVTKVADGGLVLEMMVGAGMVMKLEDRQVATSDVVGLDVLGDGVAVNRKLGRPQEVKRLQLAVSLKGQGGDVKLELPASATQRVQANGKSIVVTLTTGRGDPVSVAERQAALRADDIMDSEHEAIKAAAGNLVGEADSRAAAVAKLVGFVFKTVEKRLATHFPSASTVLEKKVGDCTEHTWLFVALARALKIPARPVYGLAYVGDQHQMFGYHAWAEVEIDGHWVAVDPTWNELLADATHLKLGSDFGAIGNVIGALSIEVLPSPNAP